MNIATSTFATYSQKIEPYIIALRRDIHIHPELSLQEERTAALVCSELEKLGLKDIAIIGIAKQFERLYLLNRSEPLVLPCSSRVLHLIQRIRDEAHRFALRYHHLLRSRLQSASELDVISGIGPRKKTALIKHFGSVDKIKMATLDELMGMKGIDKKTAALIFAHFRLKRKRISR